MPIIEPVHADAPIAQGDVLCEVPLHRTLIADGDPRNERSKSPLCMVISRPCNLMHKSDLLVAEIAKYSRSVPKDVCRFDQALDFLKTQRDGIASPDCFYLGEIPGRDGRFVAKLDALFTLSVPDKRNLLKYRIASLNLDFQRDLHLRVFNAIASLGFDDVDWLPTSDLEFLKQIGEGELADLESQAADERAVKARQEFNSSKFSDKKLAELEQSISSLRAVMEPYLAKLSERKREVTP
jgi:hypothetical protein